MYTIYIKLPAVYFQNVSVDVMNKENRQDSVANSIRKPLFFEINS